MKNTIILPEIYLHALTAFEVGTNPEHINHGLIKSGLASWVKEHLTSLKGSDYLTISGHTLDLLDEEAPELLDELISVVDKENISLVGVPYYNTSLALLSPENLTLQWEKNQQSLQHYFGKKAQSIYLADQPVPAALSPALRQLSVSVLGDQSLHVESKSLGSTFVKDLDPHVGAHSPYQERPEATDLLAHVSSELVLLEPFISQDADLTQTWQLLANQPLLNQLQQGEPQNMYNTYFSYMNILNDIAHTIRTVELTKRGEFETSAQIVEHPSSRVLEVLPSTTEQVIPHA